MRERVTAEAGEVSIDSAAKRDVETVALEESLRLHLTNEAVIWIRALSIARRGRRRVDVYGAKLVNAAGRVGADDGGRFFPDLTFNGEAVLHLVGNCCARRELCEVGRLLSDGGAVADG